MHIHVPTCRDMLLFISRTIYAYLKKYNIAKLNKITVLSPRRRLKYCNAGRKTQYSTNIMEYERRSNLKQLTNSTIGFIKFSTLGVIRLWYLYMSSWCVGGGDYGV